MVSTPYLMSSCKDKTTLKTIPTFINGVAARPFSSDLIGVLRWLKYEKLHKYWPIFSHMSYSTLLGLTKENIDHTVANLGAEPITRGATSRFVRGTKYLRERVTNLAKIDELTPLETIADQFLYIVYTPLSSTEKEPSGEFLLKTLRSKIDLLVSVHGSSFFAHDRISSAIEKYLLRPEVPRKDKNFIRRLRESSKMPATSTAVPAEQNHDKLSRSSRIFPECAVIQKCTETSPTQIARNGNRPKPSAPLTTHCRSSSLRLQKYRQLTSSSEDVEHNYISPLQESSVALGSFASSSSCKDSLRVSPITPTPPSVFSGTALITPSTVCFSEPLNEERTSCTVDTWLESHLEFFETSNKQAVSSDRIWKRKENPSFQYADSSPLTDVNPQSPAGFWPKGRLLELLMELMKLSYGTSELSVDVNVTWGVQENQVMFL
ncbi:hypothetical protein GE061_000592 [Apolygus lucorum]|uniref:SAM domain-containing protein n=1 Tax=Apolygus lucorum TaxID=248454 RepID=A0A8S9Y4Q2_APOLU|nr:hypothetical protein GE061_000592 [Apolygus lucorum]